MGLKDCPTGKYLTLLAERHQIGLPSDFIRRRHNWLLGFIMHKTPAEITTQLPGNVSVEKEEGKD